VFISLYVSICSSFVRYFFLSFIHVSIPYSVRYLFLSLLICMSLFVWCVFFSSLLLSFVSFASYSYLFLSVVRVCFRSCVICFIVLYVLMCLVMFLCRYSFRSLFLYVRFRYLFYVLPSCL